MDLSGMRLETQHLVIASTIEYAFANLDHVIVIIPEAWETIPQGKMTPVKWVAQQFIRKGAALGNYLWLDSQDIGGIDKTPLRQCDNWLMGRMKEAHEVERILKQLLGMKVAAEEIQTLPLGHFYAAIGNDVKKVYVLPVGVPETIGVEVARGSRTPESVRDSFLKRKMEVNEDLVWKEKFEEERKKRIDIENKLKEIEEKLTSGLWAPISDFDKLKQENLGLRQQLDLLKTLSERLAKENEAFAKLKEALADIMPTAIPTQIPTNGDIPSQINVSLEQPVLTVSVQRKAVDLTDATTEGKIAIVYAEGKLPSDKWFTTTDVVNAFVSHGWSRDPRIGPTLDKMCSWGFFEKHYAGKRPEYRVKIKPEDARGKGLLKEAES
jgi:hypothetical protein